MIPNYTRQWQDHQKDLELKTDLSDQINRAVSTLVTMALDNLDPYVYQQTGYDNKWINAYTDWQVSKEVIGSRINNYFSNNQINHNWNNLSSAVTEIYQLAIYIPRDKDYNNGMCNRLGHIITMHESYPENNPINIGRDDVNTYHCENYFISDSKNIQQFKKYFPIYNDSIDWNSILHHEDYTTYSKADTVNYTKFYRGLFTLKNDIESHKNNLLKIIDVSPITVFK